MARIPPYLAGTKKKLGLSSYVSRSDFPRDEYFESIDAFKTGIAARVGRAGDPSDDEQTLLLLVAGLVDRDEEFLTYVLGTNYELGDSDGPWEQACLALAHTILHEYDKAMEAGEWPK